VQKLFRTVHLPCYFLSHVIYRPRSSNGTPRKPSDAGRLARYGHRAAVATLRSKRSRETGIPRMSRAIAEMILNNSAERRRQKGLSGEILFKRSLIIRRLRLADARLSKYALSSRGGYLSDPDTIPPLPDAPRDPRTAVSTVSPDYSRSSAGRNCRTRPGSARRRADYEAVRYRRPRVFQRSPSSLPPFHQPLVKIIQMHFRSPRHVAVRDDKGREKERRSNVTLCSAASHRHRLGSRCISASEFRPHINFRHYVSFRFVRRNVRRGRIYGQESLDESIYSVS